VFLSSVVGSDFDPGYKNRLGSEGVDLTFLRNAQGIPSPFCIVLSAPDGAQSYLFMEGAMAVQKDMPVPVGKDGPLKYTHITTSHPDFAARTARELSGAGSSVTLDPGQEIFFKWKKASLAKVLPHCDRFFGNLNEWKTLGNFMGWSEDFGKLEGLSIPLNAEAFDSISEAVVTLREKGAVLIRKGGMMHSPAMDAGELVDATGAGDAFRGGFYAALLKGYSSERALDFGNAMGAIAITGEGPQEYKADWERVLSMVSK